MPGRVPARTYCFQMSFISNTLKSAKRKTETIKLRAKKAPSLSWLYPLSLLMSGGAGGEKDRSIMIDRGSGYIWKATTGRPARIMLLDGSSYPEQKTPLSFLFTTPLHLGLDILNISSSHLIPARTVLTDRHPIRERLLPAGSILEQRLVPWKASQGRLKMALLSVFCLFSLHHFRLTHRKEV